MAQQVVMIVVLFRIYGTKSGNLLQQLLRYLRLICFTEFFSFISGPNSLVMQGEKTDRLKLTKLKIGTYVFELIVTDDRGLQGKDTVNVFVKKGCNMF